MKSPNYTMLAEFRMAIPFGGELTMWQYRVAFGMLEIFYHLIYMMVTFVKIC